MVKFYLISCMLISGVCVCCRVTNDMLLWLQALNRHALAYNEEDVDQYVVMNPGLYHWRDGGEQHMNDPLTVANLQVRKKRAI